MPVRKEVYEERKRTGLCTRCGGGVVENKTLCTYHLKKAGINQKAVYARRKSSGLCSKCGNELTNNRKTCNNCLNKNVEMDRPEVYVSVKERRKLGLCYLCGKPSQKFNCEQCEEKYGIITPSRRQELEAKGICGQCGRRANQDDKKTCELCLERQRMYYQSGYNIKMAARAKELRMIVVEHYGSKCNCCGEIEYTFLAIDHINGGGNKHRKQIKKMGGGCFYQWIINQNFPNNLQILCYNCNMSKYLNGGLCAHKSQLSGV